MSVDKRANSFGKIWGEWTVGQLIGNGSCGKTAVFKLSRHNLTFTEECAMKAINIIEEHADYDSITNEYRDYYNRRKENLRKIAEQEVNLMHQLRDCSNIVQYLDFDFSDWKNEESFGTDLLIRMDLLGNLNKELITKKYTDKEIAQVGIDICTALEGCMKNNIIHRDIKPDNIFISGNNYLLGDFGISKIINSTATAQTSIGTANYAAPEQFGNKADNGYDFKIDIYSLGLTLYVIANSGRLPFTEYKYNMHDAIQLRLTGKKLPHLKSVSPELERIICKACAFKPEDRYENATEMKNDLIKFVFSNDESVNIYRESAYQKNGNINDEKYETQDLSDNNIFLDNNGVQKTTDISNDASKSAVNANDVQRNTVNANDTQKNTVNANDVQQKGNFDSKPQEPEKKVDTVNHKEIGHHYALNGQYENAMNEFIKAMEAGDRTSMFYEFKLMFPNEKSIKKNANVAEYWLENCIRYIKDSWTLSLVEYQLGEMYAKGLGVKKNHKYAEELFAKSASKGNPFAKKKFVAGKYVK